MSAREAILVKARRALSDVPDVEPVLDVEVVRPVPDRSLSHAQVVDLFDERVADYRAVVERAGPDTAAARVAGALAGRTPLAGSGPLRILVPPGFPAGLVPADVEVVTDGPGVAVAELDRCDGVLSTAAIGIAETGTIILDHGPGQGRRAATLVPDLHVCVIRARPDRGRGAGGGGGAGPGAAAHLDQRAERDQRHRTGPGRGRARAADTARGDRRGLTPRRVHRPGGPASGWGSGNVIVTPEGLSRPSGRPYGRRQCIQRFDSRWCCSVPCC